MSNPITKLSRGRGIAIKKMPYLSTGIYALAPVECPGLMESAGGGTAVTESMVLLYDPAVIMEWSDEDVATAIYHEVGHVMRDHIGRGRRYGINPASDDARIWNIAGDRLINDDGEDAGFKMLPTDATSKTLGFAKHEFRTVEATYEELKKRPSRPSRKCCGSASGHALKNETTLLPPTHPAHRAEADVERTKRAVAEDIRKHIADKGRGTVPGGWCEWADLQLKPSTIPWSKKLSRAGRRAVAICMGDVDYTYSGISHLQGGLGFGPGVPILPVMRAPGAEVTIAVDTSGSMGKTEIEEAVSEAGAIMKQTGAKVTFMACDCAVHTVKEVKTADELIKLLKGGGGTSFKPVFERIQTMRKKPDVLVFITDGGGDAPALPPPFHTIWVLVGRHQTVPTFGEWGQGSNQPWGDLIHVQKENE